MKKGKWSLQVTITVFVCAVVALSLAVTSLLVTNTVTEDSERNQEEKARNAARMMAETPLVIDALSGRGNKEAVQDFANKIRKASGVQFVVIMDMKGIRLSHPEPGKVGKPFVGGDEKEVLKGKEYTSISEGTLGRSLRSFTPIFDGEGREVGAAAVGISLQEVNEAAQKSRENVLTGTAFGILAGIAGALFLARYIKKILFGLEPFAIAKLLQERSAVLQSVREGVIAVDQNAKITLVNKAAEKLVRKAGLSMPAPVGKDINDYMPSSTLRRVLKTGEAELDEEQELRGITLLTNRVPVIVDGKTVGAVATFRDKTEISQLAEQLTGVRLYADALRAQSHEFMNKLHVILGMTQMKHYEELTAYISGITGQHQGEIGSISRIIKDPVLAGFLIGKVSKAREGGAELTCTADYPVPEGDEHLIHELITIIGNLIDNSLAAVEKSPHRKIGVHFDYGDEILTVEVKDSGSGMNEEILGRIFEKGFSTKGSDRGIGLYLVRESLGRLEGDLEIVSKEGRGTKVAVYIPYAGRGGTS
ncbi:two-component system sensor histidine kinase DcuS [Bacillus mangrovi]|uniref:histidine kinase n=1 Tax=Metabacillus mangrovi TaxID=1491830 RepID=A0A7X2S7Y8_9BACI|nr:DcuS/MalK family sensor histidine kinase [Metabacillus mangrovi]MTH55307.1 two-component system sensor histidine kinase DcuS [Metabacillus mangrovi]